MPSSQTGVTSGTQEGDDDPLGVAEYLANLRWHRLAWEHERAEKEVEDRARLERVLPSSARLKKMFAEVERTTRAVRREPRHEVVVFLHQPRPDCVRTSLRWGSKFALTDAEKQLMHSYRVARRRLRRYPEVLVAWSYYELSGVFDATAGTLELGSGEVMAIQRFVHDPSSVVPYITATLAHPMLNVRHYARANGYETPSRER